MRWLFECTKNVIDFKGNKKNLLKSVKEKRLTYNKIYFLGPDHVLVHLVLYHNVDYNNIVLAF